VGQIIESKNNKFVVGEYVLGNFGWREYWLSNGNDVLKINSKIASIQSFLGILGMTDLTAYVGLLKMGELNEGKDTVLFKLHESSRICCIPNSKDKRLSSCRKCRLGRKSRMVTR